MDNLNPVSSDRAQSPGRNWRWLITPGTISETEQDLLLIWKYFLATVSIVIVGRLAIYVMAGIKHVRVDFPLLSLCGSATTLMFVYLMTSRKSRLLAVVSALSMLSLSVQSFYQLKQLSGFSFREIIILCQSGSTMSLCTPLITGLIAAVNGLVLYKAVRVTFRYNKVLDSKVQWRNVVMLCGVSAIGWLVVFRWVFTMWTYLSMQVSLPPFSPLVAMKLHLFIVAIVALLCSRFLAPRYPLIVCTRNVDSGEAKSYTARIGEED